MSDRKTQILCYEGQALEFAGRHGKEEGTLHVECLIDGAMNAMIRMNGNEASADFAFALVDRVVKGARTPTVLPQALQRFAPPPVESQPLTIEVEPVKPLDAPATQGPQPMRFWTIFLTAWVIGFVSAVMVVRR